MKLRVAVGADHGGFTLKNELIARLSTRYDILDLGAHRFDSDDDYPDFAEKVSQAVISGKAGRGLLVCGSGVGACIAANKVPGIRAGLCHDTYSARQGVEHDDMNVLCLGARIVGVELALELVTNFLEANFTHEQPYQRRLEKIMALERKKL
ncbi:MAG: ribose 5-phosphate isomerase B [Chloroflexi bacterium]|nr:ribose 5-phosphate isomerase B [Chloroflexota bacterium]MBI3040403.1 ribose 5-phosphate isomerase B [Chloroflexota bacterium]MBI3931669.1 ribose 5-phosphate isomerase B [Chloroflexota bacterium]